jgi:hypothetical protein
MEKVFIIFERDGHTYTVTEEIANHFNIDRDKVIRRIKVKPKRKKDGKKI